MTTAEGPFVLDRVTAYDAVIDYHSPGAPRVGSRARHGTVIEVDDTRIRVAWDGGRNRRWLRRDTEGKSWHRGECSDISPDAIAALEARNKERERLRNRSVGEVLRDLASKDPT